MSAAAESNANRIARERREQREQQRRNFIEFQEQILPFLSKNDENSALYNTIGKFRPSTKVYQDAEVKKGDRVKVRSTGKIKTIVWVYPGSHTKPAKVYFSDKDPETGNLEVFTGDLTELEKVTVSGGKTRKTRKHIKQSTRKNRKY
jgi:hypothetical protein